MYIFLIVQSDLAGVWSQDIFKNKDWQNAKHIAATMYANYANIFIRLNKK